jgi:hypothetical protein
MNSNVNSLIFYENNNVQTIDTALEHSNWWWTNTELVSTESTEHSYQNRIVADPEGNIHVAWYDYTDYLGSGAGDSDIFYKFLDVSSNVWSTTEVLSLDSSDASFAPYLAADSEGGVHIVWREHANILGSGVDGDIFYRYRDASTGVWSSTEVVSTVSTADSTQPRIKIDSNDGVHVIWSDYTDYLGSDADNDIFYRYKSLGGSWETTAVVSTESTGGSTESELVIDPDLNVHVVWKDTMDYLGCGGGFDIFYKYKDSTSNLWSITEVVSTESTENAYWCTTLYDTSNVLHFIWHDYTDSGGMDADIFYKTKDLSLDIWTISEVITPESTGAYYPSAVIDSANNIHIIYRDYTDLLGSGSDADLFYKYWDSVLQSWSSPMLLSIESIGTTEFYHISMDSFEHLHVSWVDPFDIMSSGNERDVYYKRFVGPPGKPLYVTATPTVSSSGEISVEWYDDHRAIDYYLYRENHDFSSVTGLEAIHKTNLSGFADSIDDSGTYYYAVIAENEYGNSSLSNTVDVQVGIDDRWLSFISNEMLIVGGILLGVQIILFFITTAMIQSKKNIKKKK